MAGVTLSEALAILEAAGLDPYHVIQDGDVLTTCADGSMKIVYEGRVGPWLEHDQLEAIATWMRHHAK